MAYKHSPVFEKLNLDRLNRCSETVSRAEQLAKESKRQVERTQELVKSLPPNASPSANGEIEFLRAELLIGLTLCKIARESRNEDKAARNRRNARKAYDSVLHFMPNTPLSVPDSAEFESKLTELRTELHLLGEKV
jgi:hypothetical protein